MAVGHPVTRWGMQAAPTEKSSGEPGTNSRRYAVPLPHHPLRQLQDPGPS